jgi:hypothetical protein
VETKGVRHTGCDRSLAGRGRALDRDDVDMPRRPSSDDVNERVEIAGNVLRTQPGSLIVTGTP